MNVEPRKCSALNKKGEACAQFAMRDSKFCYVHSIGRFKGIPIIKNPIFQFFTAIIVAIALYFVGSIDSNQKHKEVIGFLKHIAEKSDTAALSPEEETAYPAIVTNIYNDLPAKAVIRLQDKIPSVTTTVPHVVDISIRSVQANHELLTIINIYPGSAKVDESDVRIFADLLADVGASKGIMICNSGFTYGAEMISPGLGIELYSTQEASSRHWSEEIKIPILLRMASFKFSVASSDSNTNEPTSFSSDPMISSDGGKSSFNISDVYSNLYSITSSQQISLDCKGWTVWIETQKHWFPIVKAAVNLQYWLKYFTPDQYHAFQNELSRGVYSGSIQMDGSWIKIKDSDAFRKRKVVVIVPVHGR